MGGRAVKENNLLMKISCGLYTLMINSYILCCFIWEIDVIQGQLNFLEIAFLFLSMAAFTSEVDNSEATNMPYTKKEFICMSLYISNCWINNTQSSWDIFYRNFI